jgi:hypothetical protein
MVTGLAYVKGSDSRKSGGYLSSGPNEYARSRVRELIMQTIWFITSVQHAPTNGQILNQKELTI